MKYSLKNEMILLSIEMQVAEILNNAYVNVVGNTAGGKPLRVLDLDDFYFWTTINTIF